MYVFAKKKHTLPPIFKAFFCNTLYFWLIPIKTIIIYINPSGRNKTKLHNKTSEENNENKN
ncbi:MAG: hypothetical protein D6B28_01515 [Gammaproteobacteria bacterium]|nr:MAG: hypothetical protein D6B28_01515 [Gammaproteobacteria bacterium]